MPVQTDDWTPEQVAAFTVTHQNDDGTTVEITGQEAIDLLNEQEAALKDGLRRSSQTVARCVEQAQRMLLPPNVLSEAFTQSRLDTLVEALWPTGTLERLNFEINVNERTIYTLNMIFEKAEKQAAASAGLSLPPSGLIVPGG